jgi:hypothetical protein
MQNGSEVNSVAFSQMAAELSLDQMTRQSGSGMQRRVR